MISSTIVVGKIIHEPSVSQNGDVTTIYVSVARNYKDAEKQFPDSEVLVCRAFKEKAKHLAARFRKGDIIVISARLIQEKYRDNYVDVRKGSEFIIESLDGPFAYNSHIEKEPQKEEEPQREEEQDQ